jgi:hypothetical protein
MRKEEGEKKYRSGFSLDSFIRTTYSSNLPYYIS